MSPSRETSCISAHRANYISVEFPGKERASVTRSNNRQATKPTQLPTVLVSLMVMLQAAEGIAIQADGLTFSNFKLVGISGLGMWYWFDQGRK
jgi:hypothetical protein